MIITVAIIVDFGSPPVLLEAIPGSLLRDCPQRCVENYAVLGIKPGLPTYKAHVWPVEPSLPPTEWPLRHISPRSVQGDGSSHWPCC